MSQHVFKTDSLNFHCMLLGWDRPMQAHFMVIWKTRGEAEPFYSNLFEATQPLWLDYYIQKADSFGIVIPKFLIDELRFDQVNNIGNKSVLHLIQQGIYYREMIDDIHDYMD